MLTTPGLLEVEQRRELAVVGKRLPAGLAYNSQGFRAGIPLGHQHRAGHERTPTDAVLAMEECASAAAEMIEHPLHTLLHLRIGEPVAIGRRQMEEIDSRLFERSRIVLRFQTAVDHRGDLPLFEAFNLALS